jgi:hypothetical protein
MLTSQVNALVVAKDMACVPRPTYEPTIAPPHDPAMAGRVRAAHRADGWPDPAYGAWQIGDRLLHVIRIADTATRRSGDGFALLFLGVQEASEASSLCAKVAQEVGRPLNVDGLKQTPAFSIGYALYPRYGKTLDTLLIRADGRTYQAKRAVKG